MEILKKTGCLLILAAMLFSMLTACGSGIEEEIEVRELTYGVGAPLPDAEDFILDLPNGWKAQFASAYEFTRVGDYQLQINVSNERGRTAVFDTVFHLISDQTPPVMEGVKDLSVYIGDGISYRSGITVRDNCDGNVTLEVDSSQVNPQVEGAYPVIYIATDGAGNRCEVEAKVYVYREQVTKEMLFEALKKVADQRIPAEFSKEDKVREIYDYVHYSVNYTSDSDKNDWIRAAYEGLRTGQGDCFTYFALSKAFFEYFGIENMDIQRTPGIVKERHYWNFVNIGSADDPRWYHYDATQLSGAAHSGCLLTDGQIRVYHQHRVNEDGVGNYFYAYDASAYPTTEQEVITPTPSLEPFD